MRFGAFSLGREPEEVNHSSSSRTNEESTKDEHVLFDNLVTPLTR